MKKTQNSIRSEKEWLTLQSTKLILSYLTAN